MRRSFVALALAGLHLLGAAAAAQTPTDKLLGSLQPRGPVSDFAALLTEAQRDALTARLRATENKTGAQIAVVTLRSLEGGQIDDFAEKLFKKWGIGQKGKNNGVLLLVALGDRKARIEVGYGLEPILPDALAGRVLDDELFPEFRQARYADGLHRATERVATIIEKNEPAPRGLPPRPRRDQIGITLFLGLFVGIGFFILGLALASRTCFLVIWGTFFGGIPLLIGSFTAGPIGAAVLLTLAVVALVGGWFVGRSHPAVFRPKPDRKGWNAATGGGWVWASTGGTWNSGGGGFSSGGFSGGGFGGGCSGGGGASGGW
jgi:uncharacterized protein